MDLFYKNRFEFPRGHQGTGRAEIDPPLQLRIPKSVRGLLWKLEHLTFLSAVAINILIAMNYPVLPHAQIEDSSFYIRILFNKEGLPKAKKAIAEKN